VALARRPWRWVTRIMDGAVVITVVGLGSLRQPGVSQIFSPPKFSVGQISRGCCSIFNARSDYWAYRARVSWASAKLQACRTMCGCALKPSLAASHARSVVRGSGSRTKKLHAVMPFVGLWPFTALLP